MPLSLEGQNAYEIGDVPYGAPAEPYYERMIADINQQRVEFTAHIGDAKSGSTRCDDSHYVRTLNWFNSFDTYSWMPATGYTPPAISGADTATPLLQLMSNAYTKLS